MTKFGHVTLSLIHSILLSECQDHISNCREGKWIEHELYPPYHEAQVYVGFGANSSAYDEWFQTACPIECTRFSSYFRGVPLDHIKELERRFWAPTSTSCIDWSPRRFLKSVKGKSVLLIGDSLMLQVYSSLICETINLSPYEEYIEWHDKTGCHTEYYKQHCTIEWPGQSIFTFPTLNTKFIFKRMDQPNWYYIYRDISSRKLTSNDMVVINTGSHHDYNGIEYYQFVLTEMVAEARKIPSLPSLYFMHTLPTHFNSSTGYYEKFRSNEKSCVPYSNITYARERDWRNRVADSVFAGSNFTVIPVSDGLYSQWDAHIGRPHYTDYWIADCSHYSSPSGIFRYVLQMMINQMITVGSIAFSLKNETKPKAQAVLPTIL